MVCWDEGNPQFLILVRDCVRRQLMRGVHPGVEQINPLLWNPENFTDHSHGQRVGNFDAWREVGYVVTDGNRHLFSPHEVEAYLDAVQRASDHSADDDEGSVIDLSGERITSAR
jgi:hypothetical protein